MAEIIKNRYDFVILFDVINGNPNGDPDAGNMPRIDPETGLGLVTDVCLKRKIRNYVAAVKANEPGYAIYVRENVPLNRSERLVLDAYGLRDGDIRPLKKVDPDIDRKLRDEMCRRFYDVRTFGAVMTTFAKAALNCGQVRGPVQLGFARSVDPIMPQELVFTRLGLSGAKTSDAGRRYIVPYGLYRAEGFVSANLACKTTGFNTNDLSLLWQAIIHMFELDHSAARGQMTVRELIVFRHDSEFGNAPSWKLFEAVKVRRRDERAPARCYADYEVSVETDAIPASVHCMRMV